MRRISIFGSTGSIGCNTVDLITRQGGVDAYQVVALTGGRNIESLAGQARELGAEVAITAYPELQQDLEALLAGTSTIVRSGREALIEAACMPVNWAMSAIVGSAGLEPTMKLAQYADVLALANKESLVCAGDLLLEACAKHGTELLPVDSEHSAIFQAMTGHATQDVSRIILTASGGPFRTWSKAELVNATPAQALAHPNWDMGARITVDSASMFNKALEVIEAKYLFGVAPEQVEVVVHPQSIIHSMVEYRDGAIVAQLGAPDMRGPIGYALNYPARSDLPVDRLDFGALGRLDFEAPDEDRFPSLRLAREALEIGGAAGAVLNAAKEIALDAFLDGEIGFVDMAICVEVTLSKLQVQAENIAKIDGIDAIILIDKEARSVARAYIADTLIEGQKAV